MGIEKKNDFEARDKITGFRKAFFGRASDRKKGQLETPFRRLNKTKDWTLVQNAAFVIDIKVLN